MNARRIAVLALCGVLAFALATGCEQQGGDGGEGGDGGNEKQEQEQELDISKLTEAWAGSLHSQVIGFAAEEEGCDRCHNGVTFAAEAGGEEGAEASATPPSEIPVAGTDCRACHTGTGVEYLKSGEVSLPGEPETMVDLGNGALCSTCHNARRPGEIDDERRGAPHYGPQADVLTASNGIRTEEMTVGSTKKHEEIEDACVGCHMPDKQSMEERHDFRPGTVEEICAECHDDIDDVNREAQADYDGDGSKEGFQDEVDGLMSVLASATLELVPNATEFASEEGQVVFRSETATVTGQAIPDNAYLGAWNWLLIDKDGSKGIHNPKFTVQLLQQSYEAVTGEKLENAAEFEQD